MISLILASQSPRRKEILETAGIPFEVRASPVEEKRRHGEKPVDYVKRLAREKASAAWQRPGELVLAADTVVVIDERVLEKPTDTMEAREMLAALSGREHKVFTGICFRHTAGVILDHAETSVRFSALTTEEIESYVESGEPMDKAGGYAIQGLASKFIESIHGCYFNVMGLPISMVYRYWKQIV
jgi:septum formation protein